MIRKEDTISIGKFQKPHALKGELNAILEVDPEYFMEGNPMIVLTDGILVPYFTESIRKKGTTSFLIKLSGIDDETNARQFVNQEIRISKNGAEEWLEEDMDDDEQFIGYKIIDNKSDKVVGNIVGINDNTQNILFIVDDGEDEIFIPVSQDFVISINEESKEIIMNLPEGLVDINKKAVD